MSPSASPPAEKKLHGPIWTLVLVVQQSSCAEAWSSMKEEISPQAKMGLRSASFEASPPHLAWCGKQTFFLPLAQLVQKIAAAERLPKHPSLSGSAFSPSAE
jgi:hypothetical protein